MQSKIITILFDVDDTLFDRREAQNKLGEGMIHRQNDLFSRLAFNQVIDAFLRSDDLFNQRLDSSDFTGEPRLERSKIFLQLLFLDESHSEEITMLYLELYRGITIPVRGTDSVLRKLSVYYQLGVLSKGFADIQRRKLISLGIERLFDCVVLSGELCIRKPDPRIFKEAMRMLGRLPTDCLYVGDNYQHDVVGAGNTGLHNCVFNHGGDTFPVNGAKPDFEIRAFSDLLSLFLKEVI
jgi:putative hydrolase of the HAD superfamily